MKVSSLVPEIYYSASRDFSFVGRLLEVALNYSKTTVDLVSANPFDFNINSNILDLLTTTVGFESKHRYIDKDLISVASSFITLYRKKGMYEIFEDCMKLILKAQDIDDNFSIYQDADDKYHYYIYVPTILEDIVILEDLFEYLLPSGVLVTFRYGTKIPKLNSEVIVEDKIKKYVLTDGQLAQVSGDVGGVDNTDEDDYTNRSFTYTGTVVASVETFNNQ